MTTLEKTVRRLEREIAALKAKVESQPQSDYVEGWSGAAAVLGVSTVTLKAREDQLPAPVRRESFLRAGKPYVRPVWRRTDLQAYAEGTYRAK